MAAIPAIKVRKLTKLFGAKAALQEVTFSVPAGSIFGFLGPNGAGKTTTIRCMLDFIRPTSGVITIFDKNAHTDSTFLKSQIGYLASDMQLNEKWTVNDHLNLVEKIRGKQNKGINISELLELDRKASVKNLSTGNKQKLSLALAFAGNPKLLIMDEPTRGLDPVLQNVIYDLLKKFAKRGNTVFFSSHNLSEVQRICDAVVLIKEGRVVTEQGMEEIRGANIHIVSAVTKKGLDHKALSGLATAILSSDQHHVSLQIKGDINPAISYLLKLGLVDLSVSHASLEDVFLEKYKDKL